MKRIALGIRVIGSSLAFAVVTGCSENPKEVVEVPKADETELETAERELAEEKEKLALMAEATRIAEEKAEMEAKLAEAKIQEEEARQRRLEEERQRELAALKKKAAAEGARNGLIGTKLPTLTTAKGVTYKLVEINSVTPASLGIVHDGGAAKVPLSELSDEWQKKAHYDPVEASEFAKSREAKEANYKKAVAAAKEANQAQQQTAIAMGKEAEKTALISAEERKLQAQVEKYVNLKEKTQVDLTRAFGERNRLTRRSANWNTVDKRIIALQNKMNEYRDQEVRFRALLREKEHARMKLKRAQRDEERRKERAAARSN